MFVLIPAEPLPRTAGNSVNRSTVAQSSITNRLKTYENNYLQFNQVIASFSKLLIIKMRKKNPIEKKNNLMREPRHYRRNNNNNNNNGEPVKFLHTLKNH